MNRRNSQYKAVILVLQFVALTFSFACAGGTDMSLQNELHMRLPFYPASSMSLGNGDFAMVKDSSVITWNFDSSAAPLADAFGHGAEMLVDGTGMSVVNDATRGSVLSFDGNAHLKGPGTDASLNDLPAGGTNLPFTVAFWLKPDATCGEKAGLVYWGEASVAKQMMLRFNSTAALIFSVYGNKEAVTFTVSGIRDGEWHHVALSYDGNRNFIAYFDGAQTASLPIGRNYIPTNKNFNIGNANDLSGTSRYVGLMDDFMLVDYPMSAQEVAALVDCKIPSSAFVPDVAIDGTGSLSLTNGTEFAVGTLSGSGVLGGVEASGATVVVGQGVSEATDCSYSAMIRGDAAAPISLVKRGASYGQVLSGIAENVTNVLVEAGSLSLRRPVARRGLVCFYQFDDASDLGFDAGPAGFRLYEYGDSEALSAASDGVSGGALRFANSSTNYLRSGVSVVPSRFPSNDAPYTVSAWIRPTTAACTGNAPIFCYGAQRQHRLMYLRLHGKNKFRFSDYGTNLDVTVPVSLDDGKWHHVVAVYDNEAHSRSLYFDGVLAGGDDNLVPMDIYGGDQFHIGHGILADTVYTGDMDEFMVLDCAWSVAEAADEYARKAAETVAPESLLPQPIAHYSFDNAENLGADISGNGLNLSAEGAEGTIEATNDVLACGGAVRLSGGFFKLLDYSELLPKTNHPFTVICRYKSDTDQATATSVVSIGGQATTTSISTGNIIKVGPGKGKALAARFVARDTYEAPAETGRADGSTDRQRWTTAAIVYSPRTGKRDDVVKCYLDGVEVSEARNKPMNIVDERFHIGSDLNSSDEPNNKFKGLVDDVQVFNCALSAGEIDLITRRLAAGAGKSAPESPTVLPDTATITVSDGAMLNVQATETVKAVAGAGTVSVAPLASLTVEDLRGFSGSLVGYGTVTVQKGGTLDRQRVSVARTLNLRLLNTGLSIVFR